MSFEEDQEQPGLGRQNPPAVMHDEHIPVAVKIADLKGV